MIRFDSARYELLFRDLSLRYDIEWKLQESGRARTISAENRIKYGYMRNEKSGLIEVNIPPLPTIRTREYGRVKDYKLKKQVSSKAVIAVGLTRSKGVAGVMPCEEETFHSKGLALICRGKVKHSPYAETEKLWKQN